MQGKYERIKPDYISEKEAIAIANHDLCLKNSIYREGLKENLCYGLIRFDEFAIKLVKYNGCFSWHIKVIKGEWGATYFKKFLWFKFDYQNWDGIFDENSNISCLIFIDTGEYIYLKEEDLKELSDVDMDEYIRYINSSSYWIDKSENQIYDYDKEN